MWASQKYERPWAWAHAEFQLSHQPSSWTHGVPRLAGGTPFTLHVEGIGWAARRQTAWWTGPALRPLPPLIIHSFCYNTYVEKFSGVGGGGRPSLQRRGWGGGPLRCPLPVKGGRVCSCRMRVIRPAAWRIYLMCAGPMKPYPLSAM